MALTVETGAIVEGAESYISAADATTYHAARGNTGWTGTDAVKEAALRKAAAYLDGHYRSRWKGRRVQPTVQALEWPRAGVSLDSDYPGETYSAGIYTTCLAIDVIPQRLKDAQCELALRALSGPLAVDASANVKREKVDVLETEYFAGAVPGQVKFQIVDQLLSDFLRGGNDIVRG